MYLQTLIDKNEKENLLLSHRIKTQRKNLHRVIEKYENMDNLRI